MRAVAARGWRLACVTRARTVAGGVRFIEFAVSGAAFGFEAGSTVEVLVESGGISSIHAYACLPAGPNMLRLLVPRGRSSADARFMWALIEGARVRLRIPAQANTDLRRTQPPELRGVPVSIVLAAGCAPATSGPRHAANQSVGTLSNIGAKRATMRPEPFKTSSGQERERLPAKEAQAGVKKGSIV
jgi:hypothetical protein